MLNPDPEFNRSIYKVGLGWLVNLRGQDFVGKQALQDSQSAEHRWVLRALQIDLAERLEWGTLLSINIDGEQVVIGLINYSAWSWGLGKTIGNTSTLAQYKDLTETVLLVNNTQHRVQLRRSAHI
jgi:glycine cleavage system aminomethyltransferase T